MSDTPTPKIEDYLDQTELLRKYGMHTAAKMMEWAWDEIDRVRGVPRSRPPTVHTRTQR